MSDNRHMLKQERVKQVKRKSIFLLRTVEQYYRFPRETVQAPSLEIFEIQSDKFLSNPI